MLFSIFGPDMRDLLAYLKGLTLPRIVLWCYLIWYLVMATSYFDPSPRLWFTSAGLSLVIGFALILSVVCAPQASNAAGSVQKYLSKYVGDPDVARDLSEDRYAIEWNDYDWSLNGIPPVH